MRTADSAGPVGRIDSVYLTDADLRRATRRPDASRSAALDTLAAARARWAAARMRSYSYELTMSCFCGFAGPNPVVVGVRDDRVVAVRDTAGRAAASGTGRGRTIEEWFSIVDGAIRGDAEAVTIAYDASLGYPTLVDVDPAIFTSDDHVTYYLSRLTRRE